VVAAHGINSYRDIHWAILMGEKLTEFGSRKTESFAKDRMGLFALGLDDFLAAIVAAGADVMAQMRFARGRLDGQCRVSQEIMRAMHPTFGRGLFILLNSHLSTPQKTLLLL